VIFLLAMLPLQLGWSAVATYCQHEEQLGADHFGHHEHQCRSDTNPGSTDTDKASGDIDADCSQCHGHYAGVLPLLNDIPGHSSAAAPPVPGDEAAHARALARPERPQWPRLA